MELMKGSKERRVPDNASVPIAVQTCAKRANWTASFNANAATEAEKAVPFRIPRCSLEASGNGTIPCACKALFDGTTWRGPKVVGPSKTRIEGFPINVPAIYDSGERSEVMSP